MSNSTGLRSLRSVRTLGLESMHEARNAQPGTLLLQSSRIRHDERRIPQHSDEVEVLQLPRLRKRSPSCSRSSRAPPAAAGSADRPPAAAAWRLRSASACMAWREIAPRRGRAPSVQRDESVVGRQRSESDRWSCGTRMQTVTNRVAPVRDNVASHLAEVVHRFVARQRSGTRANRAVPAHGRVPRQTGRGDRGSGVLLDVTDRRAERTSERSSEQRGERVHRGRARPQAAVGTATDEVPVAHRRAVGQHAPSRRTASVVVEDFDHRHRSR